MMLLLCACGNLETGKNQGEVAENDKIQIGMSFDSFVIERWQRDRDIFVSTAKELGAEVNVQNANGDLEQQKKQINYFIDKGMDVIVVICIDSKGLTEEVQRAKDAGIKIIAYDRLLQNTDIDLYISFDNERVGTMMGEALLENGLAGGNVLMLGGSAVDSNVAMVEKGFRKVMEDNQVTILDSMHADGWKAELAGAYIYEHMDVVSEADAIMCGNDDLASKVVHALKEKRLAGDYGSGAGCRPGSVPAHRRGDTGHDSLQTGGKNVAEGSGVCGASGKGRAVAGRRYGNHREWKV